MWNEILISYVIDATARANDFESFLAHDSRRYWNGLENYG